jgi:dihydropteroate synthase
LKEGQGGGLAPLSFRQATFDWRRTYVMGVVNVTPDSFSDGGEHFDPAAAIARGVALAAAGADLLDIGGEATNPRARGVSADEEIARIVPVIAGLAARVTVPLSIDTTKAEVARAALAAGAEIVNDISGGRFDPAIVDVTAEAGAVYVCSHLRGVTLSQVFAAEQPPSYDEVAEELASRLAALPESLRARTIVDPGLGFGKGAYEGNAALVARAGDLARDLGRPVLVGPSRKRFVAALAGATPAAPLDPLALDLATVGACLAAVAAGAQIVRVHNVELLRPALVVYEAIRGFGAG